MGASYSGRRVEGKRCSASGGAIEQFARALDAADRQRRRLDESELGEHAGLIPVDALRFDAIVPQLHHGHARHRHVPPGRRRTRTCP